MLLRGPLPWGHVLLLLLLGPLPWGHVLLLLRALAWGR